MALSSPTLTDQQLFDLSNNFIRPQLAEVEGAAIPSPYGGKNRQVVVDLDMAKLRAKGLSPQDVTTAILAQNLILPSGTQKIGRFEYNVKLNGSPHELDELNDLPRSRPSTVPPSICMTSPTCATAIPRNKIWCWSTATVRC